MKKLLISLSLLLALLGCDRFKYREQYTGVFNFATIRTNPDSIDVDSQRINYLGYVDPFGKDQLFIRFKADDSIAPTVDKSGGLTVPGFVVTGGSFTGSFSDADHLHFETEFVTYLREGVRFDVTGVRQ
jgi:hypothetical protein